MDKEITMLFLMYQNNKNLKTYKDLSDAIMQYIYDFPEKLAYHNHEHKGDFLLFMEPKIATLIEKFVYTDIPFETYLHKTLKYQFYTYHKRFLKREHQNTHYIAYHKFFDAEICTKETEIVYSNLVDVEEEMDNFEDVIEIFQERNFFDVFCRRAWIYLLKNYAFISDERMYELSVKLGISHATCKRALELLKDEKKFILEKRKRHHERCLKIYAKYLDKAMLWNKKNYYLSNKEKKALQDKINRLQKSHKEAVEAYRSKRFYITNEVVSKIVGVSKPVIDASIFHFRKVLKDMWTKEQGKKRWQDKTKSCQQNNKEE